MGSLQEGALLHPGDMYAQSLNVEGFLRLSADLNLQLQAKQSSQRALAHLILGRARVPDALPLMDTIGYLREGYGDRRRKNGPLAILHPLRTAAILSRSMEQPTVLDLLSALLHDKEEDIRLEDVGQVKWERLQRQFDALRERIDQDHRWFLGERISLLARQPGQGYHEYLARIVSKARQMVDLLHCKLADRLDNTLDIAVQGRGGQERAFFETAFGILFLPNYLVPIPPYDLPPDEDACVLLMSQLYKNTVLLSILRVEGLDGLDEPTGRLFAALAEVSRAQAQWVTMEALCCFVEDGQARRRLLAEAMAYCQDGGISTVTARRPFGTLDGTFLDRFAVVDDAERKRLLAELYWDREMLVRLMLLFVAIFTCFLNDRGYYVRGIDRNGLRPVA